MATSKATKKRAAASPASSTSSPRKEYKAALERAGVTRDDLTLLRELAEQNDRLRAERNPAPLTRIFL